jgi:endonuclease G
MVSGITKGPLWSIEHLTPERAAAADTLGGKAAFHDEDAVPPADRPSIADYTGSGMDKGALAPTADGGTIPEREERASMANVVPMSPGLARGMWHAIEASVRTLARSGNGIWVVTGPAFHGDKVTEFGTSKIIEPTAIWKAIYDPTRGATGVYVCTNVNFPTCNIFSVADLTRETGIDPFPSLAASAKATAMFLDRPTGGGYAEAP